MKGNQRVPNPKDLGKGCIVEAMGLKKMNDNILEIPCFVAIRKLDVLLFLKMS